MITPESLDLLLPGPPAPRDSWAWATVTQVSPLRVRMDGEASALGITPGLRGGTVAVGDRVWCQRSSGQLVAFAGPIDTGWIGLTLASGYVAASRATQYRRIGNAVRLRGGIRPTSGNFPTSGVVTLANLPAAIRPPQACDTVCATDISGTFTRLTPRETAAGGNLELRPGTTAFAAVYLEAATWLVD